MSRSVQWRRTLSDSCCWHQAEAQNATIYILRETGPTGFLLKEEGETKNFKVFLGDPHSCTCTVFRKEKDLCKHISWLLLKKFRISKDDPISWQLGLVEREINDVLRGPRVQRVPQDQKSSKSSNADSDGRQTVQQRDIDKEDVCPICQEELLDKRLPVTFCKFSCGNSIHIKCMKIWADHQQGTGVKDIKCPMCREDFGPFNLLKMELMNSSDKKSQAGRLDRHLGACCRSCHLSPISGKCYKCVSCNEYYLCQSCFKLPTHTQHSFQFRHKRNQRWRAAERIFGAAVPTAVANDLMTRDLSAADYELLLQLDNPNPSSTQNDMPEEAINNLPLERVRDRSNLLAPGTQCRVCLRAFEAGQFVRRLPCKHRFHRDCIDNWLLHTRPSCPVDGLSVWNPVTGISDTVARGERRNSISSQASDASQTGSLTLEIPGLGITAMNQTRSDRTGALVRRPPRHPNHPHNPLLNFEISGSAVGTEADRFISPMSQLQQRTLPGDRLMQNSIQHRLQLHQQLQALQAEQQRANREMVAISNMDIGETVRSGSNSAPPVIERATPPDEIRIGNRARQQVRSNVFNRRRSTSRERTGMNLHDNFIQSFGGLFLGNDPFVHPAESESNAPLLERHPPHRHRFLQPRRKRPTLLLDRAQQNVNMVMEGTALDNLTMRDILR